MQLPFSICHTNYTLIVTKGQQKSWPHNSAFFGKETINSWVTWSQKEPKNKTKQKTTWHAFLCLAFLKGLSSVCVRGQRNLSFMQKVRDAPVLCSLSFPGLSLTVSPLKSFLALLISQRPHRADCWSLCRSSPACTQLVHISSPRSTPGTYLQAPSHEDHTRTHVRIAHKYPWCSVLVFFFSHMNCMKGVGPFHVQGTLLGALVQICAFCANIFFFLAFE